MTSGQRTKVALPSRTDEQYSPCTANISPEAVGFLSAVGVFIILMLLLFLYINKKFCFENVGGFPDLGSEYSTRKNSQEKIYNSYMDQGEHGSSSESEDEALGRYQEALSRTHNSRLPLADSGQKSYAWETRQKYSPLSAEYDGYSSEASIDEGGHINLPFSTTTRKRMASKRKFSRKSKH